MNRKFLLRIKSCLFLLLVLALMLAPACQQRYRHIRKVHVGEYQPKTNSKHLPLLTKADNLIPYEGKSISATISDTVSIPEISLDKVRNTDTKAVDQKLPESSVKDDNPSS